MDIYLFSFYFEHVVNLCFSTPVCYGIYSTKMCPLGKQGHCFAK